MMPIALDILGMLRCCCFLAFPPRFLYWVRVRCAGGQVSQNRAGERWFRSFTEFYIWGLCFIADLVEYALIQVKRLIVVDSCNLARCSLMYVDFRCFTLLLVSFR